MSNHITALICALALAAALCTSYLLDPANDLETSSGHVLQVGA